MALLAALGRGDKAGPVCETVTWGELATVDSLALRLGLGHAPLQRRDFVGLTSLTLRGPDLKFRWWPGDLLGELSALENLELEFFWALVPAMSSLLQTLPLLTLLQPDYRPYAASQPPLSGLLLGELLAHTPLLRRLTVIGAFETLPDDLLAGVPQLQQLTLKGRIRTLPPSLLGSTPDLRQVTIESWERVPKELDLGRAVNEETFMEISDTLLRGLPRLERLELRGDFPDLPADFLAFTPQLQYLALIGGQLPSPPRLSALLRHTPSLQHLTLTHRFPYEVPADLLWSVPQLRSLHLAAGFVHPKSGPRATRTRLPAGLLAPTPRLQELVLLWGSLAEDGLPLDLLTHVPQLRSLRVPVLPHKDFLQPVPQLETLQANPPYGVPSVDLPGFYAHTPQLQSLQLDMCSKELPADLLQHLPNLQALSLKSCSKTLPRGLLAPIPNLTSLTLGTSQLEAIPEDLLAYTPQLTAMSLSAGNLAELPAGWLAPVPKLQRLVLSRYLSPIPEDLLANTPQLTVMSMNVHNLTELPAGLLVSVPELRHLALFGWRMRTSLEEMLVPGSLPPGMDWIARGWRTRPPDMYPHAQTPYPHGDWPWHIRHEGARFLLGTNAGNVAALLLHYPYLEVREDYGLN